LALENATVTNHSAAGVVLLSLLMLTFRGPASAAEALVGATIIDGNGRAIDDGVVIVEGDRLQCVGSRGECPLERETTVTDLSGHYLTPGLIDAHVHFAQTGWLDGRPDGNPDPSVYPYEETIVALRGAGTAAICAAGLPGFSMWAGHRGQLPGRRRPTPSVPTELTFAQQDR